MDKPLKHDQLKLSCLVDEIKKQALSLGFQEVGITGIDLQRDEIHLQEWLHLGRHGEMDYMSAHGTKRTRPEELVAGTLRVISVRMDYLSASSEQSLNVLENDAQAYISRYALGRDYHKVLRSRLNQLAAYIHSRIGQLGYRVFVDSAPVLEKALARNAGLGWIGKHTNLIHPKVGSWFFLGEIFVDIPLPVDLPFTKNYCGSCRKCMDVCPTQAIVAPYQLDARRCIAYLTIELKGSIPEPLRPLIGNRIYGCDDCQLFCPWNKFAKLSVEKDFQVRYGLDAISLVELFNWDEQTFLKRTEGSAIRRIGYLRWLRNIAVALGNSRSSPQIITALNEKRDHPSELVREHVVWALERLYAYWAEKP